MSEKKRESRKKRFLEILRACPAVFFFTAKEDLFCRHGTGAAAARPCGHGPPLRSHTRSAPGRGQAGPSAKCNILVTYFFTSGCRGPRSHVRRAWRGSPTPRGILEFRRVPSTVQPLATRDPPRRNAATARTA